MTETETKRFTKDFTLQEPICDEGIEKAFAILKSGKLHRYNVDPDEKGEAALLEEEFAAYMGKKYCLACASCGTFILGGDTNFADAPSITSTAVEEGSASVTADVTATAEDGPIAARGGEYVQVVGAVTAVEADLGVGAAQPVGSAAGAAGGGHRRGEDSAVLDLGRQVVVVANIGRVGCTRVGDPHGVVDSLRIAGICDWEAHLDALRVSYSADIEVYRVLARTVLELAEERGDLDAATLARFDTLLRG